MNVNNKPRLQLVGGLQVGAPKPGDYSFLTKFFDRIPKEIKFANNVMRYVGYQTPRIGNHQIQFIGAEVDAIHVIPDGMMAWNIDGDNFVACKSENGSVRIIWQTRIQWHWHHVSLEMQPHGFTGEFRIQIPVDWKVNRDTEYADFSLSTNHYTNPNQMDENDDIYLVDYDPSWSDQFKEMAVWLQHILDSDIARHIEHYGSTAIPGMPAKPIIDILVEIPSFDEGRKHIIPLLNRDTWEYWWYRDHMTFIKRKSLGGQRTHHIHMAPRDHEVWNGIAFRDYLRTHPEDALKYAELKRQLSRVHQKDREAYTEAKAEFVNEITLASLALPKA